MRCRRVDVEVFASRDLELWKRAAGLLLFVGISRFRSSRLLGQTLAVCDTRFCIGAIAFAADPSRE